MKTVRSVGLAVLAALLPIVPLAAQTSAPKVSLDDTEQRSLTSSKIGQTYDLLVSFPVGLYWAYRK